MGLLPTIGIRHTPRPTATIDPNVTTIPPDVAIGGAVTHGISGLVGLAIILAIIGVFAFLYWRHQSQFGGW
jgi:hypothetical protein